MMRWSESPSWINGPDMKLQHCYLKLLVDYCANIGKKGQEMINRTKKVENVNFYHQLNNTTKALTNITYSFLLLQIDECMTTFWMYTNVTDEYPQIIVSNLIGEVKEGHYIKRCYNGQEAGFRSALYSTANYV